MKTAVGASGEGKRKGVSDKQFLKLLRARVKEHKGNRKTKRVRNRQRAQNSRGIKVNYFTWLNLWVAIAFLGISVIIGYIYVITADVYVQAFAGMASDGQIIQVSLGSGTLSQFPLLGPLLAAPVRLLEFFINRFETTSAGLAGLGVYLIIQTLELIPTVVWESPALMLHLIERLDSVGGKRVMTYKGDPDLIKQLKKRHNEYYSNLVESLNDWRLIAFTVDVLLCFTLVKFIKVGTDLDGSPLLGRFFEGVSQFDFGFHSFHGPSTFKVLSSLFLLLILVKLGMKIFNGFGAFAKKKIED